jgi:hypothetical protein
MKTRTQFDSDSTRTYRFNHGRAPRGTGAWSFSLGRSGAWTQFEFTGTFTAAKAAAMREARSLDTVLNGILHIWNSLKYDATNSLK